MEIIVPKVAVPSKVAPAPSPAPENPQDAYSRFDQRDQAQIVDALKGRFSDEYVYVSCPRHPDSKNQPVCNCEDVVVSLSWLGIQEAAREWGGIKVPIEKMKVNDKEDSVEVFVEATDEKTSSSRIGVAVQPKKIRSKSGAFIEDEFYLPKAVSRAMRNSLRMMLPALVMQSWVEAKLNRTARAATPVAPAPAAPAKSNGSWHPSVAQVKRAFALAFGNNVSRKQLKELVRKLCGVEDPSLIGSRAGYEVLCATLQKGGLPA